jgi:hypothetical protein
MNINEYNLLIHMQFTYIFHIMHCNGIEYCESLVRKAYPSVTRCKHNVEIALSLQCYNRRDSFLGYMRVHCNLLFQNRITNKSCIIYSSY